MSDEVSDWTRYLHEKFHTGLTILAEGHDRIKERLYNAYISQLNRGEARENDLPDDLRVKIDAFHARMTANNDPTGEFGDIRATVDAMTEDEAVDMAREVVQIEYELRMLGADRYE
jgi:hypothetical protein